jgi:methyl-accepting chemotaxis protein
MPNMTIGRQIVAGLSVCLLGMLVVAGIGSASLNAVADAKDHVIEKQWPVADQAREIQTVFEQESTAARGYLLSGDAQLRQKVSNHQRDFDQRLARLQAVAPSEVSALLDDVAEGARSWQSAFADFADERAGSRSAEAFAGQVEGRLFPAYQEVTSALQNVVSTEAAIIDDAVAKSDADMRRATTTLWVLFGVSFVLSAAIAIWISRQAARRLGRMAQRVHSAATEIMSGVSQQVAGATQQAVAVQETVATVDELVQTAEQAVQRAQAVASRAQTSVDVVTKGKDSLEESTVGMSAMRDQVTQMAQSILDLTRRAQSIGDIVETVEAIAAETHLLALNAAIEAARAGEHGRGFAVVAGEVKELADQSKAATANVSKIISEIERGTDLAVVATEEGTKSAEAAADLIAEVGQTIAELGETIASAALAAEQIAGSSRQQAAATTQISEAMRNVDTVMEQNVAAAKQAEETARALTDLSTELQQLVGSRE